MDFKLDASQMQNIQNWLDGQGPVSSDDLQAYFRLGEAIRRKLLSDMQGAVSKARRLEERLERYRNKDEQEAIDGNFDCLGLDTIELAKAVLWSAAKQNLHIESKTRFRLLVYAAYCAWLGSERQRITIDHPIAQTAYGPVLPKMLDEKKVTFNMTPSNECYRRIAELEPGLARTIDNTINKYLSYSLQDVKEIFMGKDTPFRKVAGECERTGKATAEIPDRDIYLWKKSHA